MIQIVSPFQDCPAYRVDGLEDVSDAVNSRKLNKSTKKSEAIHTSIPIPLFSFSSDNNTTLSQKSYHPSGWAMSGFGDILVRDVCNSFPIDFRLRNGRLNRELLESSKINRIVQIFQIFCPTFVRTDVNFIAWGG
ncbi:unnamed protein product [Onchocerca flexuosa]|uniref:Uncharacterized protein n=1 Tax=Onchocerca flexuosa TaxID=387005 RepID=A0A183GZF3_9BILA|nr:unnamed protein product [Onchocerca flexuosa]